MVSRKKLTLSTIKLYVFSNKTILECCNEVLLDPLPVKAPHPE